MSRNCANRSRALAGLLGGILVFQLQPPAGARSGGLQVATVFDSNIIESDLEPLPSNGLKLRGDLQAARYGPRIGLQGGVITQALLDLIYRQESKLIVTPQLVLQFTPHPRWRISGEWNQFYKTFTRETRTYQWNRWQGTCRYLATPLLSFQTGITLNNTAYQVPDTIRFQERAWNFQTTFQVRPRLILEADYSHIRTNYRDNFAWDLQDDTTLFELSTRQRDITHLGRLHLRHQGTRIWGLETQWETVRSNSLTGSYHLLAVQGYLSGRWGQSGYYHFFSQRMIKRYSNPELPGVSRFRDPEERVQNRMHLQLEKLLQNPLAVYILVGYLQNETILNQRYYDKIVVELGLKYALFQSPQKSETFSNF